MAQFDAILWDIDGTLLKGHGLGRETTRRSMEQVFGTSAGIETHHFGGKTDFQTLVLLLAPHGYTEQNIREKMPQFAQAMATHMANLAPEYDINPIPEARALLDVLVQRDDLLHGIVTGNVEPAAPVKLRSAGYDPTLFKFGAYGNESPNRNDLPPKAIERASLLAQKPILPEHVLVIGDTRMDIQAAHAAGAKVCAVATGSDSYETLQAAQPDYLVQSLAQFLDVVPLD